MKSMEELEKEINKQNLETNKLILELFELDKVDERILTKEQLEHLLPLIKGITLTKFTQSIINNLENDIK